MKEIILITIMLLFTLITHADEDTIVPPEDVMQEHTYQFQVHIKYGDQEFVSKPADYTITKLFNLVDQIEGIQVGRDQSSYCIETERGHVILPPAVMSRSIVTLLPVGPEAKAISLSDDLMKSKERNSEGS